MSCTPLIHLLRLRSLHLYQSEIVLSTFQSKVILQGFGPGCLRGKKPQQQLTLAFPYGHFPSAQEQHLEEKMSDDNPITATAPYKGPPVAVIGAGGKTT